MQYIDEEKIFGLLNSVKNVGVKEIDLILAKSRALKRLSLDEAAKLLLVKDRYLIKNIFKTAAFVKDKIYGKRIVIFAPLYVTNFCQNSCLYCAFKSDNRLIKRKALTIDEVKKEVKVLLRKGHKRILVVAGEGKHNIAYYADVIKAIYSVRVGKNKVRRVNINCAPLTISEFKKLKAAGIGTYQVFQETYHDKTYHFVHPGGGPKSDPDNRLDAVNRAFKAGIDDLGIGVLYGLYDYKFETLALLSHIEYLEKTYGIGPHTVSVPRIEPALGSEFSKNTPYKVRDEDFKKIVAILRLVIPYTGIILSTRETAKMRDELFGLGVSQVSAASSTSPGGYSSNHNNTSSQFYLNDYRSLDEVVHALIKKGFIPSFCAACYRKERTGKIFMSLARPGTIKHKCSVNALVTLKEYLDDFASDKVKRWGYLLIKKAKESLEKQDRLALTKFFSDIDNGLRDKYI